MTTTTLEDKDYHRTLPDPKPNRKDGGYWVYIADDNGLLAESFYFCFFRGTWNCHTRGMIIRNVSEQDPFYDSTVWMMLYAK